MYLVLRVHLSVSHSVFIKTNVAFLGNIGFLAGLAQCRAIPTGKHASSATWIHLRFQEQAFSPGWAKTDQWEGFVLQEQTSPTQIHVYAFCMGPLSACAQRCICVAAGAVWTDVCVLCLLEFCQSFCTCVCMQPALLRCVRLSAQGALFYAADRTLPEAYTKRSRGMTEKRTELLSEGLLNTLLLSVRGHFRSIWLQKDSAKKQ